MSVAPDGARSNETPKWTAPRVLLGVTGSVAALSVPNYIFALRATGVRSLGAITTHGGAKFFTPTAAAAVCEEVYVESDAGNHVAIARSYDVFLVLPCTAHTLACAAGGYAPNLLTTALLAWNGPAVFVPAMNPAMWHASAVQRNVATLRSDGHIVTAPQPGQSWECASGRLVDGLVMPPPQMIADLVGPISQRARISAVGS